MPDLSDLLGTVPADVTRRVCGYDGGLPPLWMAAHAISALSCLAILAAALVFLRRRRDLVPAARALGAVFCAFVFAGFLTQAALLLTLWQPACLPIEVVSGITAAIWLCTAVVAWPQIPKLLALPSPADLARSNAALAQTNASLETTVAWRTYELEQARRRFELALSRSAITVFTQDRALRYTWVHNPRQGLTPGEDELPDAAFVDPEAIAAVKRTVLATGEPQSRIITVATPSEGLREFEVTVSQSHGPDGSVDGLIGTAVDVTERRLFDVRMAAMAAQVTNAYQRFELALANSPIIVFEQDRDLRYTFIHNPPPGTEVEDFIGHADIDLFDPGESARMEVHKRRLLETGVAETYDIELNVGNVLRFYDVRIEPLRNGENAIEGLIGTALDLTERRRHEQHMRLVMRELTHRSKNLLAIVQAMARKTASLAPDTETFVRDFSVRLRAMAAAHDLLVSESWEGAELRDLLTVSLTQTVDPTRPEIRIEGPDLRLTPDAAQTLGLAFHELTMNAVRHGALSVPQGRVFVRWWREGDMVKLRWHEEGGPVVEAPQTSGFGRVVLERLVGASLGGTVTLDFAPTGVTWEITFSASRLASD